MNTKQAKDFLVAQAFEEAARDGVPLSDVEKRMLYFTESDATSCENPIELNDEFEAEYQTKEYEAKISRLLYRAHARLKKENIEQLRNWDRAIRILREGDHYILVMVDQAGDFGIGRWMPFFGGVAISVVFFVLVIGKDALDARALIPKWMFHWIPNDRQTQKEAFYLLVVGGFGLWGILTLARAGDFGVTAKTLVRGLLLPLNLLISKRRSHK